MGLLEDARRLSEISPEDETFMPGVYDCHYCQKVLSANGFGAPPVNGHAPDCPFLALPQIVRVIEAAQRLAQAGEPTRELRLVECIYCQAERDLPDFGHEDHKADCPWQALVAALKSESVPA